MSGPFGSSQWMYATGGVEGQSLRFNDDDSAYLSWEPAAAGNRKTWTWSGWVKRGNLPSSDVYLFGNSNASNQGFHARFDSGDTLTFLNYPSSASGQLTTSRVFRDVSAWYHIVLVWDTTDATSGDRMRIYINGERETAFGTSSYPSQNLDGTWNSTSYGDHAIGRNNYNGRYFDGYMAEVNFVDGTAYDASYFGETDANGQWVPKTDLSGLTYGTNGFYLPFTNDYQVEGFNTVTYRGNGADQYIGGVGFKPDFVWTKIRSATGSHALVDAVRGSTKAVFSNGTFTEETHATGVKSFETDGYLLGASSYYNTSGASFVAWAWDMGTGSAASNTDGSTTSSVKANPTYGQSVITYTGTGASATVGHGLSSAPEALIVKARDNTTAWRIWWTGFTGTERLQLNDSSAKATTNTSWDGTVPAASVFSLGADTNTNNSSTDYVAYAFHSVSGYSDFGSYTGTGVAGNTVTTGFEPAFVMIKKTNSFGNWYIYDNLRGINRLQADQNDADYSQDNVEFLSDGFELTSTASGFNGNGSTYIYMAFADKREAAFWLDQSGNNNDWTNNNMQESDISLDNPTNNFATVDRIGSVAGTFSEGNLKYVSSADTGNSTMGLASGAFYFEVLVSSSNNTYVGVIDISVGMNPGRGGGWTSHGGIAYKANGDEYELEIGGTATTRSYGSSYTSGDIIGVACDVDADTVTFYKNGVSQGTTTEGPSYISSGGVYGALLYGNTATLIANFGQDSSFAGNEVAQGNTDENGFGDFYYEPPAGYLALCTQNLPDPDIDDGEDYFNTVLYTGNGSTQSITGVGFQPDWTWVKERSSTSESVLTDAVRGATKRLVSSSNAAEDTSSNLLTSFDSDGFSVGSDGALNQSSQTYAAWNWLAGGTGVANTDGSISSTVSANTTAGFSIVSYTGTGANATVGHGLDSAPDMYIVKNRDDVSSWITYHKDSKASGFDAEDSFVSLNETNGVTDSTVWNNTAPTSSVFSLGTSNHVNGSSDDMIAYCFHSVEGYSKFGSYTGNGSSNGPFVYTGFRPAFLIVKKTSAAGEWVMWDNERSGYNVDNDFLYANGNNAEFNGATYVRLDLVSNGFKMRDNSADTNGSGATYIYMAFAENPFKYSNAR